MESIALKPFLISLSVTDRCDLSCPHCFMEAKLRSEDLPFSEMERILRNLAVFNSQAMLIITGGEPLLREDIDSIVALASDLGFITVLGTSGRFLTLKKAEILKGKGLKGISVSVDSVNPNFHDNFRGSPGLWKRAIEALKIAKALGIETQMNVTLTDQNADQLEDFVKLGLDLGVKAVNFFFIVCTGRAAKSFIKVNTYGDLLKRLQEISLKESRVFVRARCAPHLYRFFPEKKLTVGGGMKGCPAGRHYVRIDSFGNVYPCPYLPISVGSIRNTPFKEIWESSPVLEQLRKNTYGGKCGLCRYRQLCGGCRARAFSTFGDIMAEDPLCDYEPQGKEDILVLEEKERTSFKLEWTKEAKERMESIPLFIRGIVISIVEQKAREEGIRKITPDFLKRIRRSFNEENS